jgi:uracil-DNA glycosylase family 4
MPKTFVPPEGDITKAKYIIIGEQPGQKEIRYGKPFVGPAGRELSEDLQRAGINRSSECYLTNVIKDLDRPLSYYFRSGRGDPTLSKEGIAYLRMLESELSAADPKAILIPAGNVALYAVASRTGITKWRGSVIKSTTIPDRIVIPIIHPATVIFPKNVYLNKILIQFDLKKAKEVYKDGYTPPKQNFTIRPTYYECTRALQDCFDQGLEGRTVDYDIEIYNEQLSCISFATSTSDCICVPFVDNSGDYFSIQEETDLMKMIATILENPKIRKRGQNIVFDSTFLLRRYGIKAVNMDDTMIAQQIIMPEFPKGLDFIASIWTDIPYYKAEGKKFMKSGGVYETLWNYNCWDSITCAKAFPRQLEALAKQDNVATYERQRKLIEPLVFMMENGIKINVKAMSKRYDDMAIEIDKAREELNQKAGTDLNANSPKQLINYFYLSKGIKPYLSKGRPSTNELAMKRLARRGLKEANLVLKIRRLVKERSTYLNPDKVDPDGRMRCSYNPVGTRYSRLSSSQNIFGTGNNLQNQPHNVLEYFAADEDQVIYGIDLSQAENRIVAYVGRVDTMIEAFEKRLDIHSLTGSLISGKPYEDVKEEDRNEVLCPLGGGDKTWRFWGKKANHGLNYDLGYRKFALYYEIPERDGKYIVERYHSVYPGVRQGYHVWVRKQLSDSRTITNLMGRKTLFLDRWDDSLFKEAYACTPQGTVGDVINERGLEYCYYTEGVKEYVTLLMQVHDSIVFELPLSLGWTKHAEILLEIKNSLETPLFTHGREFVIPADIAMGYNMYKNKMKEIKGVDCPTDATALAKILKGFDGELRCQDN